MGYFIIFLGQNNSDLHGRCTHAGRKFLCGDLDSGKKEIKNNQGTAFLLLSPFPYSLLYVSYTYPL